MPLSTDFDIEVTFDLQDSIPYFVFQDTNDYAADGDTLIAGSFRITSPAGQVIYETPAGSPDIVPGTLSFDALAIPTDTEARIVQGEYCFEYWAVTTNNASDFYRKKTFVYGFCSPKVVIETASDCFIARFRSRDKTEYTVQGITPALVRLHEVSFPPFLSLSTLSSNSVLQEVSYPNLYEGTYTSRISSVLVYDFGNGVFIRTRVEGQKETLIKCDLNLCKVYCCIRSLKARTDQFQCENRREYEQERRKLIEVIGLMVLFEQASRCGKSTDADAYLKDLLRVANCESGGPCGQCDGCGEGGEPQQIAPFVSVVNTSGTNQWLNGVGAPSGILGNDEDFYLDAASGKVYEKVGGTWVLLLGIKGEDGEDGQSTQWLSGSGEPASSVGNEGDYFLVITTGDVFVKTANGWELQGNIQGPQGAQGAAGDTGPQGPTGPAGADFPIGAIIMYTGSSANFDSTGLGISGDVTGWARCNGNNGTLDMTGRFPAGLDPTDSDYNVVGKTGGSEAVTLSLNQIPSHHHAVSVNSNNTGVTVDERTLDEFHASFTHTGSGSKFLGSGDNAGIFNRNISHDHAITDPGHGHSVNESERGGGQPHENRPPYVVVDFIQKLS